MNCQAAQWVTFVLKNLALFEVNLARILHSQQSTL